MIATTPFNNQSFVQLTYHMELRLEIELYLSYDSIHNMLHHIQIILQLYVFQTDTVPRNIT